MMIRSLQEIDGQLESERKYVERLAVEDFGSTHVGKVSHYDDPDMIFVNFFTRPQFWGQNFTHK